MPPATPQPIPHSPFPIPTQAYKLRWFVLKGNMLFYYKSERDKVGGGWKRSAHLGPACTQPSASPPQTPIGVIILERCRLEQSLRTPPEYYYSFKIIFDGLSRGRGWGRPRKIISPSTSYLVALNSRAGPDTREYELATPRESDMLSWMKVRGRLGGGGLGGWTGLDGSLSSSVLCNPLQVMKNAGYECLRAAVYDLQMRVWEEEDRQGVLLPVVNCKGKQIPLTLSPPPPHPFPLPIKTFPEQ